MALIVIDMQTDFVGVDGYFDACGLDIAAMRRPIEPIRRVLAAARAAGMPVVFTREGSRPDLRDIPPHRLARSRHKGPGIGAAGPLGRYLVRGEPCWEVIAELQPEPGEHVIDKIGNNAFYATELDIVLRRRGIDRLLITGVTTDVCVLCTVAGANDRGYESLVIADCCAAPVGADHDAALRLVGTVAGSYGAVAEASSVLTALDRMAR